MAGTVAALKLDAARAALLRVDERIDETTASVTVTLVERGERLVGVADGGPEAAIRPLLVATAVLRAVGGEEGRFSVRTATIEHVGDDHIALVLVDEEGHPRPLVGSAIVEMDNRELGFARATLDAINRRAGLQR